MKENWCECEAHCNLDLSWVMAFYRDVFIPTGWGFRYTTLSSPEQERYLDLIGKCNCCGGRMRCGISIPGELTCNGLFEDVLQMMLRHRPYDDRDSFGIYHGKISERSQWYWKQDQLTQAELIEQFTALFLDKDQAEAQRWAEKYIPIFLTGRTLPATTFEKEIVQIKTGGLRHPQSIFYYV